MRRAGHPRWLAGRVTAVAALFRIQEELIPQYILPAVLEEGELPDPPSPPP